MKKRGICLLPDACYLSELNVSGKPNRTNLGERAAISPPALFHISILVIVPSVSESGFLLLQLPAALVVDVSWQNGGIARWRAIRHLLHSTTKLHSAAQQITAVAEIHTNKISQETFSA